MYIISFWNESNALWSGVHIVMTFYNGVNQYITNNLKGNGKTSTENPMDYARYYFYDYYVIK